MLNDILQTQEASWQLGMSARDVCILTLVLVSLFIGPVVSTDAPAPATEGEGRTLRVLVVGNSLSFENNGTYQASH